ncbi:hypothetical protein CLV81_1947 [Flagellimonas meridianipacifica]|uniref:Uncharacterized protein n=1 Tax=Flagellimonas meridianipacifica TaxID=1080225 RepID=A0A2T0MK36_9FLAO|nr:hypothetical protein CLV81_1947 [Allomuricauda pacifica]
MYGDNLFSVVVRVSASSLLDFFYWKMKRIHLFHTGGLSACPSFDFCNSLVSAYGFDSISKVLEGITNCIKRYHIYNKASAAKITIVQKAIM